MTFFRTAQQLLQLGPLLIGMIQGVGILFYFDAHEISSNSQGQPAMTDAAKAQEWQLDGDVASRNGNNQEAIHAYREAVRLAPAETKYHCSLGRALAQNNDLDTSLAELREASRLNPEEGEACALLGMVLHRKGDLLDAITEYQKALTLDLSNSSRQEVHQALKKVLTERNLLQTTMRPDYSDPVYWFAKIEEWRKAVENHHPGQSDMGCGNNWRLGWHGD